MKKKVLLTGGSGFVGMNLKKNLDSDFNVETVSLRFEKGKKLFFDDDIEIIIHAAGKAHDLKNSSNLNDYLEANFELTKQIYSAYLESKAKKFIFFSSVKAVADTVEKILDSNVFPNPKTHYGISKRKAEIFINNQTHKEKQFYILRPCMIHGENNKGNLNLLYKLINNRIPWFLGAYVNSRSFLNIDNLVFIVRQIMNEKIPSGEYFLADDKPVSTNLLVKLIGESLNKRVIILNFPKSIVNRIASFGDILHLPLNSERLNKLTENYIVDNSEIKKVLKKELPFNTLQGLKKTFKSFK